MSRNKNNNNYKGSGNYTNASDTNSKVRDNRKSRNNGSYKEASRNKNLNSAPGMFASNGFHVPDRSHNDPGWFKDPRGLVEEASRYGNYQPTGRAWLFEGRNFGAEGSWDSKFGVPSALMCEYIPFPGVSQNATSAMSIAAQQIYQHIRRSLNKVLTGYQFADVVIAYTCFMSLVIQAKELIRDYSIANSWSSDNFSYPYGILASMGYSLRAAKDLINNMANYRQRFNTLMYQASSIFLPFETNHLLKYEWMSSGLWGDKDNPKAQVYGYTSMGYYEYHEAENPDNPGSEAHFVCFDYGQRRLSNNLFAVKLTHLENCISYLRNSDSFNYMMSDLRTAYADVHGYVFDSLAEDQSITIDYNDVMLRQFQNIRTLPQVAHDNANERTALNEQFKITQDVETNTVLCHPNGVKVNLGQNFPSLITPKILQALEDYYLPTNFLINWSSSAPSVDEVIENMNGALLWQWDDGKSGIDIDEGHMSCYVPVEFHLVVPDDEGYVEEVGIFSSYDFRTNGASSFLLEQMWKISMFDWFPLVNDVEVYTDDNEISAFRIHPFIEDDVLAPITQKQISAINKAEQFAIWRVANTGNIG